MASSIADPNNRVNAGGSFACEKRIQVRGTLYLIHANIHDMRYDGNDEAIRKLFTMIIFHGLANQVVGKTEPVNVTVTRDQVTYKNTHDEEIKPSRPFDRAFLDRFFQGPDPFLRHQEEEELEKILRSGRPDVESPVESRTLTTNPITRALKQMSSWIYS